MRHWLLICWLVMSPVIAGARQPEGIRDIHVVIDPGHGGHDPGAKGPHQAIEKRAVLGIARQLKSRVNHYPGFKAYLTRRDDRYIPLRQRLRLARQHHADLFISIHADAFKDHTAQGASIYALSKHGATSEAARWLARRENKSEMGGVNLSDKGRILRSILLDMSQTASLKTSLTIGHDLLEQLGDVTELHYQTLEQAAFVVLKSPDVPSLLVESGFISNPKEAKRLMQSSYQGKLAHAIARGVYAYFNHHPPQGSRLALMKKQAIHYTVQSGDNLSSIAQHFHTSVAALMTVNGLSSSRLIQGQSLKVPVSSDQLTVQDKLH